MLYSLQNNILQRKACTDPEGAGTGGPDPLKITKIKEFLSNTDADPLKNHKATKPALTVGPSSAYMKIITCNPSIYTIDHPDLIAANFIENSIGLKSFD